MHRLIITVNQYFELGRRYNGSKKEMMAYQQALELYFQSLTHPDYRPFESLMEQPYWLYRQELLEQQGVNKFLDEIDSTTLPIDASCIITIIQALRNNPNMSLSTLEQTTRDRLLSYLGAKSLLATHSRSLWISLSLRDTNKAIRKQALEFLVEYFETFTQQCYIDFSYAQLIELEQDKAKLDFSGHYLYGVNFNANINLKGAHFEYACLCKANFSDAYLKLAFFEGAWLEGANFKGAILDNAHFEQALGVDKQLLSEAASKKNIFLTEKSDEKVFDSIAEEIREAAISYANIEEQQGSVNGTSPNWPKEVSRWRHDTLWNGNTQDAKICELLPHEPLYRIIAHMVYITSDYVSVADARLFNNQVVGALEAKSLRALAYAVRNTPKHEGYVGSVTIKRIQILRNPELWKQYQAKKAAMQNESMSSFNILSSTDFPWYRSLLQPLPIIDKYVGECLLFHGVKRTEVMPFITQVGFTTKFMKPSKRGWGELGKGIYLGEEFSKSATYVRCPACKVSPCRCEGEKPLRQIFLTRTLLGRVREDRFRSNRWADVGAEGYHSSWGPVNTEVEGSQFKHNEFAVPNGDQVYPEFIITYQENSKEFSLQKDTFVPNPGDWLARLKRIKLETTDLVSITPFLENFHRLLCYRKEDLWSLQTQLGNIQKTIGAVLQNATASFDEKTLCQEIQKILLQESQRLKLILPSQKMITSENDLLRDYQLGLFHCQKSEYEKALPFLQRLAQHNPNNILFRLRLAGIYHRLGSYYQHAMVETINESFLKNPKLTNFFLASNILSEEIYYQSCLDSIAQNKTISEHSQENQDWIIRVLTWHAEQRINNSIKQREVYDQLPELIQKKFVIILLNLLPNIPGNQLKREQIFTWPDASGKRIATMQKKDQWQHILSQTLTEQRNTGVKLHWIQHGSNGMALREAYLKENFIGTLLDPKGECVANDGQQGRCLVKALCDQNQQPIAFIKFYPKYPLRQQLADEFCYRLSGYGAMTSLGFLIHERTKKIYPILVSQSLGIAPEPKDPKQRHLLAWEFLGKDSDIEDNLDPALFTWKVFETYLLQPKDEKNDNLFPFLNPVTQQYGIVSGDADRILCQTPMENEIVHLNSNIFLMSLMQKRLDRTAVAHFQTLDPKRLIQSVIEYFQELQTKLLELGQHYQFNFESQEMAKPKNVGKQTVDVDSHLLSLFRDDDLSQLYQRFVLLQQILDQDAEARLSGSVLTHELLIRELMPTCAEAYKTAREVEPQLLTSSPRFLHLNNKYKRETKTVQIEAPDGKGTVTRTTTYSQTEAPQKRVLRLGKAKNKETLLPITRLPQQIKLLDSTYYLLENFHRIIEEIHEKQNFDSFKQAPSDFIRELVWNNIDWRLLQTKSALQAGDFLNLLPTFKCTRLRLAHCDVTDKPLMDHLKNNRNLTELYIVDSKKLSTGILKKVSKLQNLKRLVIADMPWEIIQTDKKVKLVSSKLCFPHLKELKIKNCPNLVKFTLHAPRLQILTFADCQRLNLSSASLNLYSDTLIRLVLKNIMFEGNQLTNLAFKQLKWLECHDAQLQRIDIRTYQLIKLDLSGCSNLNYIETQSLKVAYLSLNACRNLDEFTLQSILAIMNGQAQGIEIYIDNDIQTAYPLLIKHWPIVFKWLHSRNEAHKNFLNQLENKLSRELFQTNLIWRLSKDDGKQVRQAIIRCAIEAASEPIIMPLQKMMGVATAALQEDKSVKPEFTPALQNALKDPDWRTRIAAVNVLAQLGEPTREVLQILSRLLDDTVRDVSAAAAATLLILGQQETPEIISPLFKSLEDQYSSVRALSATALGKVKQATPAIIRILLKVLRDKYFDRTVCAAAAGALAKLDQAGPEVTGSLLKDLVDIYNPDVRTTAATTLGKLGQAISEVIDALLRTLDDEFPSVRAAAAGALGELQLASPEIIQKLLRILNDREKTVCIATIGALGKLKQTSLEVFQGLINLLDNPDKDICAAAVDGLNQLRRELQSNIPENAPMLDELLRVLNLNYLPPTIVINSIEDNLAKEKPVAEQHLARFRARSILPPSGALIRPNRSVFFLPAVEEMPQDEEMTPSVSFKPSAGENF